jgi:hypothetical protein
MSSRYTDLLLPPITPYSNYVKNITLKENGGWTVTPHAPKGFLKRVKKNKNNILKKKPFTRNVNTFTNTQKMAFIKKVKVDKRIMAYKITPSYGEYIVRT